MSNNNLNINYIPTRKTYWGKLFSFDQSIIFLQLSILITSSSYKSLSSSAESVSESILSFFFIFSFIFKHFFLIDWNGGVFWCISVRIYWWICINAESDWDSISIVLFIEFLRIFWLLFAHLWHSDSILKLTGFCLEVCTDCCVIFCVELIFCFPEYSSSSD